MSAIRAIQISEQARRAADDLEPGHRTLDEIPECVASRMADCWTECLQSSMAGDEAWAFLARYRSRLLLGPIPSGLDRNTELKRRLQLWERGCVDELLQRRAGQHAEAVRIAGDAPGTPLDDPDEERLSRRTRQKTATGGVSRAMKGLVGGVAAGDAQERAQWATEYIPRSESVRSPFATRDECEAAREAAWGAGDQAAANREMRQAGRPGSIRAPGHPVG